jgi:hypothetical protein
MMGVHAESQCPTPESHACTTPRMHHNIPMNAPQRTHATTPPTFDTPVSWYTALFCARQFAQFLSAPHFSSLSLLRGGGGGGEENSCLLG